MEIPGLSRITSPGHAAPSTNTAASQEPQTEVPPNKPISPRIEPSLEAKIAAMRAQIKQKESEKKEQATAVPDTIPEVKQPATIIPTVNFNILDQVLATHGLETMSDSDEEMVQDVAEESDSDTSSYVSSNESDSDDEDSEADVPMTAEEREQMLIAADNDTTAAAEIPRTKNEVAEDEEPVRVPDFNISSEEPIESLGIITSIVGKACVVTGTPSPETRVLDCGSLLVFEDRQNLGYIADTFGPVILPMFSVRFKTIEDLESAGVTMGKNVFVVPKHAQYVFSNTLNVKGTDASNIHDEEQSETEFSDDEQEALYKSQKKQQRKAERGAEPREREPRPLNDLQAIAMAQGLTYDPFHHQLHSNGGDGQAPMNEYSRPNEQRSGRGRGRGRGTNNGPRGGRGRGRPEINNYGRGPQEPASTGVQQMPGPPGPSYQRAYYQPNNPGVAMSAPGQSAQVTSTPGTALAPALYQPLKRPS